MEDKNMKLIMKMMVFGIVFFTNVGYINVNNKSKMEDNYCLEIIGIALDEKNQAINGVQVSLLKKNEEMEWVEVTSVKHHDHNFKFILEANEYYTIEVSKPGYVKRLITVSTILPANVALKPLFSFGFEVVMFKEKAGVDDYYLDFPIALIGYNPKTEVFENNYSYTYHIKNKIKESAMK